MHVAFPLSNGQVKFEPMVLSGPGAPAPTCCPTPGDSPSSSAPTCWPSGMTSPGPSSLDGSPSWGTLSPPSRQTCPALLGCGSGIMNSPSFSSLDVSPPSGGERTPMTSSPLPPTPHGAGLSPLQGSPTSTGTTSTVASPSRQKGRGRATLQNRKLTDAEVQRAAEVDASRKA